MPLAVFLRKKLLERHSSLSVVFIKLGGSLRENIFAQRFDPLVICRFLPCVQAGSHRETVFPAGLARGFDRDEKSSVTAFLVSYLNIRKMARTQERFKATFLRWLGGSLFLCSLASAEVVTLDQAYARVLDSDQSIKLAWTEVQQAQLLPREASNRRLPRLQASASTGLDISSRDDVSGLDRRAAIDQQLSLSQPLLDFTIDPATRAGHLAVEERELACRRLVRETLVGVTEIYYDILKNQALVKTAQESLSLAAEQKKLATARLEVGEVLRTDVLRAEVIIQRSQRSLTTAENDLNSALTRLALILNWPAAKKFQVAPPSEWSATQSDLEALRQTAQQHREDSRQAELIIRQRQENQREATRRYWPSLQAQLSTRHQASDTRANFDRGQDYQASLQLDLPLFSGGQRQIDQDRARLQLEAATLEAEKTLKLIDQEVTDAYLRMKTASDARTALQSEVTAASESYRQLQALYQQGEVKSLDVLEALNDLITARNELTVQQYDEQIFRRQLAATTATFEEGRIDAAMDHLMPPQKKSAPATKEAPHSKKIITP
jgi:outer membrane protein